MIQLVIASLQLLNRTQAAVVLLIDICFFIYFIRIVCSKTVFSSKFILTKVFVQECCIMMALITITLFSFTEKTDFSSSPLYSLIEIVTILSIIGAAGADFLVVLVELFEEIKSWCRKSKKVNLGKAKIENQPKMKKWSPAQQQSPFKVPRNQQNPQPHRKKSNHANGVNHRRSDPIFSTGFLGMDFELDRPIKPETMQKKSIGILSRQGMPKKSRVRYREPKMNNDQIKLSRGRTGYLGSRI